MGTYREASDEYERLMLDAYAIIAPMPEPDLKSLLWSLLVQIGPEDWFRALEVWEAKGLDLGEE